MWVVSCTIKQHDIYVQETEERKIVLTNDIEAMQTELVELRIAHADEVCDYSIRNVLCKV
jgi:hypothetical protein